LKRFGVDINHDCQDHFLNFSKKHNLKTVQDDAAASGELALFCFFFFRPKVKCNDVESI